MSKSWNDIKAVIKIIQKTVCHSLKLWGVPVIDDVVEAAAKNGERESCELCFTDIGLILQQTSTTEFHFHHQEGRCTRNFCPSESFPAPRRVIFTWTNAPAASPSQLTYNYKNFCYIIFFTLGEKKKRCIILEDLSWCLIIFSPLLFSKQRTIMFLMQTYLSISQGNKKTSTFGLKFITSLSTIPKTFKSSQLYLILTGHFHCQRDDSWLWD